MIEERTEEPMEKTIEGEMKKAIKQRLERERGVQGDTVRIWMEDFTEIIRYNKRNLDIITRLPSNTIILTSGGERTPEMLNRINKWLKPHRISVGDHGTWVLHAGRKEHEFKDGMKIDRCYKVSYKNREHSLLFGSIDASMNHLRLEEKWREQAKARKVRQEEHDRRATKREKARLDKIEMERRVIMITGLTSLGREVSMEQTLKDSIEELKRIVGVDGEEGTWES